MQIYTRLLIAITFALIGCAFETTGDYQDEDQALRSVDLCFRIDATLALDLRHDLVSHPEHGQETTGSLTVGPAVYDVVASSGRDIYSQLFCNLQASRTANPAQPNNYLASAEIVPYTRGKAQPLTASWHQWSQHRFRTVDTTGEGSAISTVTGNGASSGEVVLGDSHYVSETVTRFGELPLRTTGEGNWNSLSSYETSYPDSSSITWSLPHCYSVERTLVVFAGIYCEHAFSRLAE